MLTKIKIENFKGIKNCEISNFGRVNIFVGRNNSGKSSILDALCLIKSPFNPTLFNEPIIHLLLRRKGIERTIYVARNFWHNYITRMPLIFNLEFEHGEKLNIETRWLNDTQFYMYFQDPSGELGTPIESKYFARRGLNLGGGIFDDEGNFRELAKKQPQNYHYLSELVLIDDYLARKLERLETNVFGRILEPRLDKEVAKELNDIYDVRAEGLTYIPISPTTSGFRLAIPTQEISLHIDELGDGAKYATAILSLCHLLENSALLIEEIESHQHSNAIKKLLPILVKRANEKNVQLFITTHSFEVIQTLSRLPVEYDVHFYHIQMLDHGNLAVREFKSPDAQLFSDLGVDLSYLEFYKRFIVVEGDDDLVFINTLSQRYNKSVDEIGYLVKAGNKEMVKHISTALLSTNKKVLAMIDYNKEEKESIMQSFSDALKNRNYRIQAKKNNIIEIEGNLTLTVLPLGLYGDEMLENNGIMHHEMEDYCLKLLEMDDELRSWAGIGLKELIEDAKKAGIEKLNLKKSSTLLQVLALKKGMTYKNTIEQIIKNASKEVLEKVISKELKEIFD